VNKGIFHLLTTLGALALKGKGKKILNMKYFLFALLFSCFIKGYSQQTPTFNLPRYEDDFSYLKYDTSKTWYDELKYQPLSTNGNSYLSFGGDFRYQYFYMRNESWEKLQKLIGLYLQGILFMPTST
jgi:hypothetical protein